MGIWVNQAYNDGAAIQSVSGQWVASIRLVLVVSDCSLSVALLETRFGCVHATGMQSLARVSDFHL